MKFLKDFGALVAVGLAILGGAVTYGGLKTDVQTHSQRLEKLEPVVAQSKEDSAVLRSMLSDMKAALDRLEDRIGTKQ